MFCQSLLLLVKFHDFTLIVVAHSRFWRKIAILVLAFVQLVGVFGIFVLKCELHKNDHRIPLYVAAIEYILVPLDLIFDIKQTKAKSNLED